MKYWFPIGILAAFFFMNTGCAGNPDRIKIPSDAVTMEVAFSWEGIRACEHESPEIKVSNVPEGTTELRVQLKDLSLPVWNHGGGNLAYDGTGFIPAGALTMGYNGPCPPNGRHKYEFSVMAVNADDEIIGFGKARQSFPPKQ